MIEESTCSLINSEDISDVTSTERNLNADTEIGVGN